MKQRTRDRILETARAMFNTHGFGQVTIEMLAGEIGIARGNLWYHFKTKEDLIMALTRQFTEDAMARTEIRPVSPATVVDDFITLLKTYSEELRTYRFLYRDQAEYGRHNADFVTQIPVLYAKTRSQFLEFYRALISAGYMDCPEALLEDLSKNTVILLRFGLEYLGETGVDTGEKSGAVKIAVRQYLSLIAPTLSPEISDRILQSFQ